MPGALTKGLRFGPDPAASGAYPAAREAGATTNLDDLLGERGFSAAEGHLEGHTMQAAIFYGKGLRDATSAIRFFFEEHKSNKKLLMKALEKIPRVYVSSTQRGMCSTTHHQLEGRPSRRHPHFERVLVGRSATDWALEQALW